MKRTTVFLWTIGLTTVLSVPAWAEATRTYFNTVVSSMTTVDPGTVYTDLQKLYVIGGVSTYDELASDPRIAGPAEVHLNVRFDFATLTGPMWGWAIRDRGAGAWRCWWVGTRTLFTDQEGNVHTRSTIMETGVGSGSLAGLVARWTITAVDADLGNPFVGGGFVVEAKGGPDVRPMRSQSEGAERVSEVFFPLPEPTPLPVIEWEILDEVAQVSHLGRSSNKGLGMLDIIAGTVTGSGTVTSANGDQLYWVATGTSLGPSGPVDLTLHWAGGTGRFDAAVGEIRGDLTLEPDSHEDPSVMDFKLDAQGNIQF
jgi:hypothetical protein